MLRRNLLLVLALSAGHAVAQPATPTPATLAERQARRFPQPVRVGLLVGRKVLQPLESQPVLGRVVAVVRRQDGGLAMVVRFGGLFGFGARPIAVPIEAMALLGDYVAIMDYTPAQLATFPTYDPSAATALPPDAIIHVGLTKPFH